MGKPPVGFAPLKECLHMIGKEQIDAYFADKEAVSYTHLTLPTILLV